MIVIRIAPRLTGVRLPNVREFIYYREKSISIKIHLTYCISLLHVTYPWNATQ